MPARHIDSLADVDAAGWNGLLDSDYPFVRHEFLAALERHGCAAPQNGWQPHHLLLEDDDGNLRAAAPMYLKAHSQGEFVFDWAWADAYHRCGLDYYPKLLTASPFNPVVGPRLLAQTKADREALVQAWIQTAGCLGLSSAHGLFLDDADRDCLQQAGCLLRSDCHYHWHNHGYADFDDFLSKLSSRKRKKIRRERRRVAEARIRIEPTPGHQVSEALWHTLYGFYARTYLIRGQRPYLNLKFLLEISRTMPGSILLFIAWRDEQPVGVAICLRDETTLYGRHWGCAEEYHSLHFESCYYAGIEYCIRHGLLRYDAGAQGEHKLQRGFEPLNTYSAHWIEQPQLREAIADFLRREGRLIEDYTAQASRHSAFRKHGTSG